MLLDYPPIVCPFETNTHGGGGGGGGGGFSSGGGGLVGSCRRGLSEGRGAKGQTLGGLKGSKRAKVGGGGGGENLTECFCKLSLGSEMG